MKHVLQEDKMFTLYMGVVNSSQSVGFTKCRIIPSIYWMTHVEVADWHAREHVFYVRPQDVVHIQLGTGVDSQMILFHFNSLMVMVQSILIPSIDRSIFYVMNK